MLPKGSIARVYQHYFDGPKYKAVVLRSMREFFDDTTLGFRGAVSGTQESVGFYNEWFLYDFDFGDGETTLEYFIRTDPLTLSEREMQMYRDLCDNRFGLFEILSVRPLESVHLRLLPSGEEFNVREFSGTMDMREGWGAFGRVARVGDHYELVGADSFTVPLADPGFQPYLKQLLEKGRLTPKDIHIMLTTGSVG